MRSTTGAAAAEAAGGSGPALTSNSGYRYQRRDVERTTLYRLVRDHLETFYQAVEEGFASAPLPNFVKQEFERFLDCGVLCRGGADARWLRPWESTPDEKRSVWSGASVKTPSSTRM